MRKLILILALIPMVTFATDFKSKKNKAKKYELGKDMFMYIKQKACTTDVPGILCSEDGGCRSASNICKRLISPCRMAQGDIVDGVDFFNGEEIAVRYKVTSAVENTTNNELGYFKYNIATRKLEWVFRDPETEIIYFVALEKID